MREKRVERKQRFVGDRKTHLEKGKMYIKEREEKKNAR
jgi:hypothetical protein